MQVIIIYHAQIKKLIVQKSWYWQIIYENELVLHYFPEKIVHTVHVYRT